MQVLYTDCRHCRQQVVDALARAMDWAVHHGVQARHMRVLWDVAAMPNLVINDPQGTWNHIYRQEVERLVRDKAYTEYGFGLGRNVDLDAEMGMVLPILTVHEPHRHERDHGLKNPQFEQMRPTRV